MNQENIKICRLCLKIICSDDFDRIDNISRHMLKTLLLKLVLDISKEPMMCSDCAANLQKSFDFKLYCLKTENRLQPFTVSESNAKLNLVEIYLEEKKNMINMLKDQRVCRICIEVIEEGYFFNLLVAKEDILIVNVLQNHIPELDLTITEDPVVCNICRQSLGYFYSFIKNCLIVEETIKGHVEINGADDMGQIDLSKIEHPTQLNDTYFKDILQPKLEDTYADSLKTEANSDDGMEVGDSKLTVSHEEIESTSYQNPESLQEPSPETNIKTEYKCIETKHSNNPTTHLPIDKNPRRDIKKHNMVAHKNTSKVMLLQSTKYPFSPNCDPNVNLHVSDTSEVVMLRCYNCPFETKYKRNLKRHMKMHRKFTRYECEACTFKTYYKVYLQKHMISHKDSLEVYKCETCACETNDKSVFDHHMQVHGRMSEEALETPRINNDRTKRKLICKNPSKIKIHTCEVCSYQSKRKDIVERHKLTHKESSEVIMYKCEICMLETKYKSVLKRHRLTHQSSEFDIRMFKCDKCSYESKYKADVKKHVLIHKKPSEIMMYKCQICDYETKYKTAYNRHMIIHRDPSEVTLFECEICLHKTKYKSSIETHMLTHNR